MTFWADARPATPRWRLPRGPRGWSRPGRVAAVVLVTVVVGLVGVSVARADRGGTAGTTADRAADRSHARPASDVVRPRWTRTLPDWVVSLQAHRGDAIAIGRDWVSAVGLDRGELRWQAQIPTVDDRGVVRGDTVLLATAGAFVALERATGELRWMTETPETPGVVALVGAGAGQVALGSTAEGGLVGLDSRTGRARWSVRLAGAVRSTPAVDRETGLVATVWGVDGPGTELRVVDGATGTLQWSAELGATAGAPVVANGMVIVHAGTGPDQLAVRAFALADGSPRWRSRVTARALPDEVPLVDGGHLVTVDEYGTVTRIALVDGRREWETATGSSTGDVAPIRVGDAVLMWGGLSPVVALDRSTGAVRSRHQPPGLTVGLAASDRTVVLAQSIVDSNGLMGFDPAPLVAPARSRR